MFKVEVNMHSPDKRTLFNENCRQYKISVFSAQSIFFLLWLL